MDELRGKTMLVGVSGGIAAYKTCLLVSRLVQSGASVYVVMTKNATEFVAPLTFESLSHNRVVTDTFDRNFTWEVEHVALAKKAELAIIAPATANVIGKLACGIADDFLTTTLLACKCPVIIAPAMNTAMMNNAATTYNIEVLRSRGYNFIYGESGYLACGDVGSGRMAEPEILYAAAVKTLCTKRDLEGKTVLVTSGATRTALDPVRFLTNRSSGKMGYAIASAAYDRGARVIYVKGHTDNLQPHPDWITVGVDTTANMLAAVKKNIGSADIAVMAAAPCDYNVIPAKEKIKSDRLTVEFTKAPDIAAWVGKNKAAQGQEGQKAQKVKSDLKLVVFAAETNDCKANALFKLQSKNADMVVLNDITQADAGFDVDTNIATLITSSSEQSLPVMSKRALADVILDKILQI